MTILVTGAAGFVGSYLSKFLSESGEKVYAVDSFKEYYSVSLKELRVKSLIPENVEFVKLDLCNATKIDNLVRKIKPKWVYHMAAQAGVRLTFSQTNDYVQSNIVGFINLLQSCIQHEVSNFIYASSSSVYGNSTKFPFKESDREIVPISFYGATKLSNEYLTSALVRNTSIKARGLRFFTVYGPWGRPDMAYFRITEALINNRIFQLFGNGEALRDFTYIDDIVKSTILLGENLENLKAKGYADVVNIGGGRPHTMTELINTLEKISHKKLLFEKSKHNDKDVLLTIADLGLQNQIIKEVPQSSLEHGLSEFYSWAIQPKISKHLAKWVQSVN